jgi:copper chaperone CopZ
MRQSSTPQSTTEPGRPRKSRAAKLVPIAIVVLVIVAAALVLSRPTAGTRTTTDTSVTIVVSNADAVETESYPVTLLEGSDPGHEADHIIDSVRQVPGVALATLDWSSGLVLSVEFDPEVVSAPEIAGALAAAGYLVAPAQ